jgi:acyl-CoA thioester hydrolase
VNTAGQILSLEGEPVKERSLFESITIRIRFNEVDAMGIVWHGHYIKYLEEGREALGNRFGLNYLSVYDKGYTIPLVKTVCDFKKPLRYGDQAIVHTRLINCDAAKLIYRYEIFRESDMELAATGETIQVFLNLKGELSLVNPPFYEKWKKEVGLTD